MAVRDVNEKALPWKKEMRRMRVPTGVLEFIFIVMVMGRVRGEGLMLNYVT